MAPKFDEVQAILAAQCCECGAAPGFFCTTKGEVFHASRVSCAAIGVEGRRWIGDRDPDVRPTWSETGLPLCDDACPNFDGKRCKAMGHRPDRFCEPMLVQLAQEATEHEGQGAALRAYATRLEAVIVQAHVNECPTVRDDGECDGCYMSEVLATCPTEVIGEGFAD